MAKKILFSTKWYERRIHLGVLQYAQQHKWDVISSHHMPGLAFDLPDVDGQIVEIGVGDRRRLKFTQEFTGPVVALEDFGDGLDVPRVHTDNRAVGRLAARHLLDRGFRQFATVCKAHFTYATDRLEGFHDEIRKLKSSRCLDIELHARSGTGNSRPLTLEALAGLPRPLGVFCVDDDDAGDLTRYLDQAKICVPEEVAIVGVNDDPMICPFTSPPISSVDPGFEAIGSKAAKLLDQLMRGQDVPNRTYRVKPKQVTTRRSSDIQAVDDLNVAKALRFIWDQAEQWVSVGEIAAHSGIPTRTLQGKFRDVMGHSLQDEMTKTRITRVREQLLTTDKSAKQIAEDMNFTTVQYMIRLFSKEMGLSPLKYRQLHKNGSKKGSQTGQ